ncbi:MAG: cytochrome c3 family protein [Desulfobacterales bacterium]|nr:cytochrome c3 family protein [Desulfobacterales bacterium]
MEARKPKSKGIMLLVALLPLLLLTLPSFTHSREVTINVKMKRSILAKDCMECHADAIKGERYANSVHGTNACTSCHVDIIDLEKHAQGIYIPKPVDCNICHKKETGEYANSVHHVREKFSCVGCHTDIHYLQPWEGNKIQIIKKCTSCHAEEEYVASGHERAVMKGNNDSAVCSDCHGLHDTKIWHTAGRTYPVEAREFYTRACDKCHADKELMKKNNLTTIAVETYEHSIHGKIQKLGYAAAGCADCHTSHNILPKEDPNSSINEKNLIKVCSRCHTGVNANFIKFIPHAAFEDRVRYPQLFWTTVFMVVLLVVVLVFYWAHTFLWWRKAFWEKQRLLAEGHLISDKVDQIKNPGETYIRFTLRDRILHLVVIFTFFGLAATGMPIKFTDAPWAKFMLNFIAGFQVAALLHRICALILIVAFLIVLGYCFHFTFFNKRVGKNWKERLSGPYSLLPRKKDWEDFIAMGKWFVDQGPPPKFDHWTYWEKFDFLAVFWGMVAIGLSGMMMWLPHLTTKLLPGWVINVARIVHSDEALLAVIFIFTTHFFNTHWVPTKWPMNYSIFTGRIYKWEFLEDRPIEYERLKKRGELEKLKTAFPSIFANFLSGVIGMSALIIGLLFVILIIWTVIW